MKILFVANNINWKTLNIKLKEVKNWFAPKVDIQFDVLHTSFNDVPFTPYTSEDNNQNKLGELQGVDPVWYDKNITPLAFQNEGYEMIILLLPRKQWPELSKARGWRADADEGVVKLQVACDEKEKEEWGGYGKTTTFYQLVRHEIMHGLYMISGQNDQTHYWFDRGMLEVARDSILLTPLIKYLSSNKRLSLHKHYSLT